MIFGGGAQILGLFHNIYFVFFVISVELDSFTSSPPPVTTRNDTNDINDKNDTNDRGRGRF